jgi:hypothetical protein
LYRYIKKVEDTNASGEKMRIPPQDVAMFVAIAACSIIGLNLSLMLNTIGFYQVGLYKFNPVYP